MTLVFASNWMLPRFWEGALLLPPHVLVNGVPANVWPWTGHRWAEGRSLLCLGPSFIVVKLPSSIRCCGLSSTGLARLQRLGARGSAAETAAAVLVEQSLVMLSPFLLFQSVPCKEYLKESKVLQSWRKALPDVASSGMFGQASAGSLLHCTVWAREMRLWQPPTRNSEMLLKPRRKKQSIPCTSGSLFKHVLKRWVTLADANTPLQEQPEFPRTSDLPCGTVCLYRKSHLQHCLGAFTWCSCFSVQIIFLKKCLPSRRNNKRELSINTTAVWLIRKISQVSHAPLFLLPQPSLLASMLTL